LWEVLCLLLKFFLQILKLKTKNLPQTEEEKLKQKTKNLPQTEEQKLKLKTKNLPQTKE
jgi:hypothetical protein